jgi:hypothetical protein
MAKFNLDTFLAKHAIKQTVSVKTEGGFAFKTEGNIAGAVTDKAVAGTLERQEKVTFSKPKEKTESGKTVTQSTTLPGKAAAALYTVIDKADADIPEVK